MTHHGHHTLQELHDQGVSIWLDDLSRDRLATGGLAALIADRWVVGVTTNPTIFQAAIMKSELYADQISTLAASGADRESVVHALTTQDVRTACDLFAPVAARTGGLDGRVSIEVDPRLAHETDATLEQARGLWAEVGRDNLLVKIPATRAGLPAIRSAIAEGVSVNVTLIFSTERYREVMFAYVSGLEDRRAAGQPIDHLASVASFFVSRDDTEVDKRLERIGTPQALALRGKAAVANARLAYEAYEDVVRSSRWQALAAAGARPQRPLWASTGVKNPAYADTLYVTELVAPGTVNTMPEATLDALYDHGALHGETIRPFYADAHRLFDEFAEVGIDLADVFGVLEDEGVEKFETSWNDLLASVEAALHGG
jgi:transaldolase